jgi:hypothetical protein
VLVSISVYLWSRRGDGGDAVLPMVLIVLSGATTAPPLLLLLLLLYTSGVHRAMASSPVVFAGVTVVDGLCGLCVFCVCYVCVTCVPYVSVLRVSV